MERLTKNKRKMIEVLYEAASDALYGLEISERGGHSVGSTSAPADGQSLDVRKRPYRVASVGSQLDLFMG